MAMFAINDNVVVSYDTGSLTNCVLADVLTKECQFDYHVEVASINGTLPLQYLAEEHVIFQSECHHLGLDS